MTGGIVMCQEQYQRISISGQWILLKSSNYMCSKGFPSIINFTCDSYFLVLFNILYTDGFSHTDNKGNKDSSVHCIILKGSQIGISQL